MPDQATRKPTPPGTILREEFLKPYKITRRRLAEHLGWSIKQVDRICDNEAAITPEKALQLGAAFKMSPEFWMKAQAATDLWEAAQSVELHCHLRRHTKKLPLLPKIKIKMPDSRHKYFFNDWEIGEVRNLKSSKHRNIHSAVAWHNKRHGLSMRFKTKTIGNKLQVTRIK
jgi:addiction module HigA family antidote